MWRHHPHVPFVNWTILYENEFRPKCYLYRMNLFHIVYLVDVHIIFTTSLQYKHVCVRCFIVSGDTLLTIALEHWGALGSNWALEESDIVPPGKRNCIYENEHQKLRGKYIHLLIYRKHRTWKCTCDLSYFNSSTYQERCLYATNVFVVPLSRLEFSTYSTYVYNTMILITLRTTCLHVQKPRAHQRFCI